MHYNQVKQDPNKNVLGNEQSPYLRQHASNPIWWRPWGEEAFQLAKNQEKPVFLSIGYSTCYWCHFMEEDSFSKQDIADILNEHFVSIKVDREERPDVDETYMHALVSMKGSGGWPISMFLTSDGKPFYGDSTIRHDDLVRILQKISDEWQSNRPKILDSGNSFYNWLSENVNKTADLQAVDDSIFKAYINHVTSVYDHSFFGLGTQQKFPHTSTLGVLMRLYRRTNDPSLLTMITDDLDMMAKGGLHDWMGGGFHRYCVDREWTTPHFEKMLYDNAGLLITYLEAFQLIQHPYYLDLSKRIVSWLLRDMYQPNGGFYSAVDAGKYEKEGVYYVWTYSELEHLLSTDDFDFLKKYFDISEQGNFEHQTIVFNLLDRKTQDILHHPRFISIQNNLMTAREKRSYPHLDDKIIVSWNGRMISAFAKAFQVIGDPMILKKAQETALFIKDSLWSKESGLKRNWRDQKAFGRAVLNDYSFLIDGLLELYQSDFNQDWLVWALDLQTQQDHLFWDDNQGGYFFHDGRDSTILTRSKIYHDSSLPAGNSMAALNLLKLADYTFNDLYTQKAKTIFELNMASLKQGHYQFGQMVMALDYYLDSAKEVGIVGHLDHHNSQAVLKQLYGAFLPNKVIGMDHNTADTRIAFLKDKPAQDDPVFYVCEQGACQLPTTLVDKVLPLVQTFKTLY